MVVQPVNFHIPPEIVAGIARGDLVRIGGVIRDLGGHIVKHLDEVPNLPESQEAVRQVAARVKHLKTLVDLKDPRVIAGFIILSAVTAGGILHFATRTRKQPPKPEQSEWVQNYNTSLTAYLEAVRDGALDAGILDRLIFDLDALKERADDGRIALDFSTQQAEQLVDLVVGYTKELAKANSVDLDELQDQAPDSNQASIVDLRRHLEAQRQIFSEAA